MSIVDRWLLPDGVEDVLPGDAAATETIRRGLLDVYNSWGYEYVIPPMIEFLESLLTGTGRDLDLKTCKLTDLVSGRTLGIRADITPQVARIDAHSLNRDGIVRLCYAGTVIHSQPDNMLASRTPLNVGAELFGETGGAGDLEIVSMMIESLNVLDVPDVHLELGDVSIYRKLIASAGITAPEQEEILALIQRKSHAELAVTIDRLDLPGEVAEQLLALPGLCGDQAVLERARTVFKNSKDIVAHIDNLSMINSALRKRFVGLDVYFDLSELRGYDYHTGIVFAAYVSGSDRAVAKGGRYDHVGEVFGRARAATGFTVIPGHLTELVGCVPETGKRVLVINNGNESLWKEIRSLRQQGYIVIESGDEQQAVDYLLTNKAGQWQLEDR